MVVVLDPAQILPLNWLYLFGQCFFLTFNVNLDKTIVDILNDEFSGVD